MFANANYTREYCFNNCFSSKLNYSCYLAKVFSLLKTGGKNVARRINRSFQVDSTKLSITRSSYLRHLAVIEILCPRRQLPKGIPRRSRDFSKHSRVTGATNFCYLFIRTKRHRGFMRERAFYPSFYAHTRYTTNKCRLVSRCILAASWFPELAKNENAKLPGVWNSLHLSYNHLL